MAKERTALLIIDMLNDFIEADGKLVVESAKSSVELIKKRLDKARKEGWVIIYLTDAHRQDDPEFDVWPPHAIAGTWGAEIIKKLKPKPKDYIIPKRRYSGLFGTQLDLVLRENDIENIVICGVLSNICVLFTAVEAKNLTYNVSVPRDSVASISDDDNDWALKQMELHGVKII